jgi:energy-converting hydrogenase B subunit Q
MDADHNYAISLVAENQAGVLRDIGFICTEHNANIVLIHQGTIIH